MEVEIRESQIRDILALLPKVAAEVLSVKENLVLLRKEYPLPRGRLDLLLISRDKLHLIELKMVSVKLNHIDQLLRYKEDLEKEKSEGKLTNLEIVPYIICPKGMFPHDAKEYCQKMGIIPVEIDIDKILYRFLDNQLSSVEFINVKPIALMTAPFVLNKMLYYLDKYGPSTPDDLVKAKVMYREYFKHRKPQWLIRENYVALAKAFGLVIKKHRKISLTELGEKYVKSDPRKPRKMSDKQANFIRENILRNPFGFAVNYGVYSLVETIFELSKNAYQVPRDIALQYFILKVGKFYDWKKQNVRKQQFYRYARFAEQLGLVAIAGEYLCITPAGIDFTIKLQLHKALSMMYGV